MDGQGLPPATQAEQMTVEFRLTVEIVFQSIEENSLVGELRRGALGQLRRSDRRISRRVRSDLHLRFHSRGQRGKRYALSDRWQGHLHRLKSKCLGHFRVVIIEKELSIGWTILTVLIPALEGRGRTNLLAEGVLIGRLRSTSQRGWKITTAACSSRWDDHRVDGLTVEKRSQMFWTRSSVLISRFSRHEALLTDTCMEHQFTEINGRFDRWPKGFPRKTKKQMMNDPLHVSRWSS